MRHILDLDRYPLDQPGTPAWEALVAKCRADLAKDGMYNLPGFVRAEALRQAVDEIRPVMDTLSFTHKRRHNIYFRKEIPGLAADHPALAICETVNHTVCADQITQSIPVWIYEWSHFVTFLAATMGKDALFPARDDLARVNVMSYREGEALNWHFDRSEFTTTLLLQAPEQGGEFIYRTDLRSDENQNYDGVARLPRRVFRGFDDAREINAGDHRKFRGVHTFRKTFCLSTALSESPEQYWSFEKLCGNEASKKRPLKKS